MLGLTHGIDEYLARLREFVRWTRRSCAVEAIYEVWQVIASSVRHRRLGGHRVAL